MPVLANARHDRFAQGLAAGMSVVDAYGEAGFKPHRQNASRLMAQDAIRGRVAELQEATALEGGYTRERLIGMCQAIDDRAMQSHNQFSAAMAAVKEIGTITGLRVERSASHTEARAVIHDEPMTQEAWVREFCGNDGAGARRRT